MSERPRLRATGPQPADLAAFLAGAEYATLQAPHGSNEDATESLISAGCFYAPRLLAAVETVLARHKPELSLPGLGPGGTEICAVCDDAHGPERWPCAEYEAISRALLGDTP